MRIIGNFATGRAGDSAGASHSPVPQQPHELEPVETVAAHERAVQQQHRHIESVAALQLLIRVDVDNLDRRQRHAGTEDGELAEHLLTQCAVVTLHDGKTRGGHRRQRVGVPTATGPWACTCVAMNCTVAGGTSPTAVILWPSTTVEKAELEPTVADCGTLG